MAGKRKATDENSGQFINVSGPPQKRPRRIAQPVTEASMMEAQNQWEEKQREEAAARYPLPPEAKTAPNVDDDIFPSQDGSGHLELKAERLRAKDFVQVCLHSKPLGHCYTSFIPLLYSVGVNFLDRHSGSRLGSCPAVIVGSIDEQAKYVIRYKIGGDGVDRGSDRRR
ncbi:hypothetical protein B0H10DRAFT_1960503 [Mycena sp. CBHHK59/15]|nr:hypothetical protein B0H10DRAFT_1960503 [Mycena sp. CBHHK59/15]